MKNLFRALLHHYIYDLKLKSKLVISHMILFLLPAAVLTGFLFMRIYSIVMDDTIRSELALSNQTVTSLENLISHLNHSADTILSNSVTQNLFFAEKQEAGKTQISAGHMKNLFHLTKSLLDHDLITSVKLYYDDTVFDDLTQHNQLDQELFEPISAIRKTPWFDRIPIDGEERLLCPSEDLSPAEAGSGNTAALIARLSYSTGGKHRFTPAGPSALLAIYFSTDPLDEVLRQNASVEGEAAFLINSQNKIAACSDQKLTDDYFLPFSELQKKIGPTREFTLVSYERGPAYTAYFPIQKTDWHMVSVIPLLHIADTGKVIIFRMAAVYVFFALIALFIAFRLSASIADRIIAVALQMEKVRTGRPQPLKLENSGCDEIGILTDTYNYMTEEICDLMDRQEAAGEELRRAEFRALQAQINPHFLYNTLDMINWLSQTGQTKKVTQAIQALSRFYKLTLGRRELMNTIGDELEHMSLYVKLQNMRYDDCVELVLDVPEELNSFTIPKLTFQPIVENAFVHGILMKEEKKGTILVTGWRSQKDILFIISDDGAGIPPEKLSTLLDSSEQEDTPDSYSSHRFSSRHIGVYNTNLRLKSLYGDIYGLSFTSSPGHGTEVTVRIPARRGLEDT